MDIFYKYNGKYGSLEINFTDKSINDALQWKVVAQDSEYNPKKFLHILRKILNVFFDDEKTEYVIKDEDIFEEKMGEYLKEKLNEGYIEVSAVHDKNEDYLIRLNFNNDSKII